MSPFERELDLAGAKSTLLEIFCLAKIDYIVRLQVYFAITCYTLLHQATRGEGKTGLRKSRDILVFDRDPQRVCFIILP